MQNPYTSSHSFLILPPKPRWLLTVAERLPQDLAGTVTGDLPFFSGSLDTQKMSHYLLGKTLVNLTIRKEKKKNKSKLSS